MANALKRVVVVGMLLGLGVAQAGRPTVAQAGLVVITGNSSTKLQGLVITGNSGPKVHGLVITGNSSTKLHGR